MKKIRSTELADVATDTFDLAAARESFTVADAAVDAALAALSEAKKNRENAEHEIGAWLARKGKGVVIKLNGKQWSVTTTKGTGRGEPGEEGHIPARYELREFRKRLVVG